MNYFFFFFWCGKFHFSVSRHWQQTGNYWDWRVYLLPTNGRNTKKETGLGLTRFKPNDCIGLLGLLYRSTTDWVTSNRKWLHQSGACKFEPEVLAGSVPCEGPEERVCCSLSSWLAGGCLLSVSSHHLPSGCVGIQMSSPGKDTSPIGSGPTLMTSL